MDIKNIIEMETPEEVAKYRAKRLKCGFVVDLCCGTGNDTIALAKECGKVLGIDSNPIAIELAKKKAELEKLKNVEFYCQDCFFLDLKKLKPDVVFADPSRRKNGKRTKSLSETEPSTTKLIEFIKNSGIKDFCIEASSNLDFSFFPEECEKEISSLNNSLNCISLYFGNLKKSNYSVVVLPQNKSLKADKIIELENFVERPLRYLFELDKGITKARMQGNLLQETRKKYPKVYPFKENLFTSNNKAFSPFFSNTFRLIGQAENSENLQDLLKFGKAGKVVIRGKFKNQSEQLMLKKKLSEKLKGERKLHIFYFEGSQLVLRKVGL